MIFKKVIIPITMMFFIKSSLYSQSVIKFYDDFSSRYFTHLYNFEYNDVKSMLDSIDTKHKTEKHLYLANYYFWRTISGDNTNNYFSLCKEELYQQLSLNKKSKLSRADSIFLNSITYSYLMRLELMNNNYIKGIKILDQSINNFEKTLSNNSNYEPFLFLTGLYNYFTAYTSRKYAVFNVYLLPYKTGDKTLGIKQLKKCAASQNMVIKTEALYFLLKIYLNTENNNISAKYYAETLLKLYPGNIIFHREYYILLSKMNLVAEAKKEKENILSLLSKNNQLNDYQRNYFRQLLK